jgi:hypothetical protein
MSYFIIMKYVDWDQKRSERLQIEREISFEDIFVAMEEGNILDIIEHLNKNHYPQLKFFVIDVDHYAYIVPFYEDDEKITLQTIIPSRRATEKYLVEGR